MHMFPTFHRHEEIIQMYIFCVDIYYYTLDKSLTINMDAKWRGLWTKCYVLEKECLNLDRFWTALGLYKAYRNRRNFTELFKMYKEGSLF